MSDTAIPVRTPLRRSRSNPCWWDTRPTGPVTSIARGEIVCADALRTVSGLHNDVADVVFLDPPFNLGKDYGSAGPKADRLTEDEYASYIEQVLIESTRILRPGGALYLYHIPRWALHFTSVLKRNLEFRHWIAIAMKNGFVRGTGLYPAHYALLHYTKGSPAVLNRPKIPPLTCPNCDEYVKDYGGYRSHVEKGVNLSDVWDDLSPVRHKRYKHRFANELPMAIPKRVLEISGRRGGLLVDPFSGTGTSAVAARIAGMYYVAVDREPANCQIIAERMGAITARKHSRKDASHE